MDFPRASSSTPVPSNIAAAPLQPGVVLRRAAPVARLGRLGRTPVWLACLLLLAGGCADPTNEEPDAQTNTALDTLFLGYELGMAREAFYNRSWELNRQGLVMQGPQNQTVQYELEDQLPHPARMYFYPDFYQDRVFQMRVRFVYDGWAPWNTDLSSDSLLLDVVDLFRKWYGDGFIKTTNDRFGTDVRYVKIDGHRRIMLATLRDKDVVAVFTDLNAEKAMADAAGRDDDDV